MSIYKSYFSKSNTLIYNSYTNTARNPIVELFYGRVDNLAVPIGYSRYIFDLDLTNLTNLINTTVISTGCTSAMTHTLKMTNTSFFDNELLNSKTSQGRRRATSFDLVLFRIPKYSGSTGLPQQWDSGVGYDYYDFGVTNLNDRSFSDRPSNWFQTTTLSGWSYNGIYDNTNSLTGLTKLNFTGLTIVDTQHFEFGNENIEFDMTNEINGIIHGTITGTTGWGIAFYPQLENITGLTENYSVGFFSPHTQTFYEPYLQTTYDDIIDDDRNNFTLGTTNKLYLYVYKDGDFQNLDQPPLVSISDSTGTPVSGLQNLQSCLRTKGVYEVVIPPLIGYKTPCLFTDTWSNIRLNGFSLPNEINEFTVYPTKKSIQIGTNTNDPAQYGFTYYGLKQNEKILRGDIRKVGVIIKQAYTANKQLPNVDGQYRVYVREGQTEVIVQDWTTLNRTPNEYYFIFDTRDKIPNEYFVDIKVTTSGQVNVYKQQINFQIVNEKVE